MKILFVYLNGANAQVRSLDTTSAMGISTPEIAVARGTSDYSARTVPFAGKHWRMVAVPAGRGQALVLAQSLEPTDQMLGRLGLVMLLFGVAGMIIAGLAGWAVARNGLRPVRRLTTAVEDIARTQRLDPIPIDGSDEVARLAASFNEMLRALSASQRQQRRLVADAGHELRTPLTSLRTNLDLLAQADGRAGLSAEARAELLADVRAQIEELSTLVGDLVELAREEPAEPTVEPVELAAVVAQAVERVRRRRHRRVRGPHQSLVGGRRLCGAGAGDHEPARQRRQVESARRAGSPWSCGRAPCVVSDQGPGIAAEDLDHVFERFYRSAESRGMPGSGLGLSIVRSVAERHGGRVSAGTAPGGGAAILVLASPVPRHHRKSWLPTSDSEGRSQDRPAQ